MVPIGELRPDGFVMPLPKLIFLQRNNLQKNTLTIYVQEITERVPILALPGNVIIQGTNKMRCILPQSLALIPYLNRNDD